MDANQGKPTMESLAAAVDNAQADYKRCVGVQQDAQNRVEQARTAVEQSQAAVAAALQALKDAVTSAGV